MNREELFRLIKKYGEPTIGPTVFREDVLRDLYWLLDGRTELPRRNRE